jgi:hypothetical protein
MQLIFWATIVLLTFFAMAFFVPWLYSQKKVALLIACVFSGTVYALYSYWGSSSLLGQYYSKEAVEASTKQVELRRLMTEFKKEEYRLRFRLEENSKDLDAEWRLLDLLAIKALLENNKNLAKQYWEEALKKCPDRVKEEFKDKLKGLN